MPGLLLAGLVVQVGHRLFVLAVLLLLVAVVHPGEVLVVLCPGYL